MSLKIWSSQPRALKSKSSAVHLLVILKDTAHLGGSGVDRVEFMWSANKGQGLKSLMKIASGGELSRLMLAVKRVCVKHDLVSLYIFDEVDTHGKVAPRGRNWS